MEILLTYAPCYTYVLILLFKSSKIAATYIAIQNIRHIIKYMRMHTCTAARIMLSLCDLSTMKCEVALYIETVSQY